jgi:hypothetical protein
MTGIAELAPILKAEVVAVVKVAGYFDESEDASTFCLAGWLAPTHHWDPFEKAWQSLVDEYGMPEFHMYDCQARKGFWESWTNPADRWAVQFRFLDVLTKRPPPSPYGSVVAIDLDAHSTTGSAKPWLLAFDHILARMVELQRAFNWRTADFERLALVFDEKDEFRARALEMVDRAKAQPEYRNVIGSVTFDDSKNQPALQAADLLAYEARRAVTALYKKNQLPRAQWLQLKNAKMTYSTENRIRAEYYDASTSSFLGLQA